MKITATLIRLNVMVRIQFAHDRKKHIATGVRIDNRSQWHKGAVVGRTDAPELNATIGAKLAEVKRIVSMLELQGVTPTPESVTSALLPSAHNGSFLDFMHQRMYERPLSDNTRRNTLQAIEALRRFGRINTFASLTTDNLALFDKFLHEEQPRAQTTIRGYHARIKPYVAEAVLQRYIPSNPYDALPIKRGTHKMRNPLTEEELLRIVHAKLPDIYAKAQDLFIFQAYTGLSYADTMSFVASQHVVMQGGHAYIQHKREKTGTQYYTPLLPYADAVLLKYGERLPRLSNQRYNLHLHAIGGIVGIAKPLTSHVARHSFATMMLSHDVPIEVVSRMLGHTDIDTTQIYAKVTTSKIAQVASRLFCELE